MYALLYLQALGDPAQAFCNFLLFCVFDKTVRTEMLKKVFSCCQERNDSPEAEEQFLLQDSGSHEVNTCNGYGSTPYGSGEDASHNV